MAQDSREEQSHSNSQLSLQKSLDLANSEILRLKSDLSANASYIDHKNKELWRFPKN